MIKGLFPIIILIINLGFLSLVSIEITFFDTLHIHAFLFSLSLLSNITYQYLIKKKQKSTSVFLSINIIRIALTIIFLLPVIIQFDKSYTIYIYNFFCVYFSYLFFDLYLIRKLKS